MQDRFHTFVLLFSWELGCVCVCLPSVRHNAGHFIIVIVNVLAVSVG